MKYTIKCPVCKRDIPKKDFCYVNNTCPDCCCICISENGGLIYQ